MISARVLSTGLALAVSAASVFAWTVHASPQQPPKGPYQVVVSKPVVSPGHRVGTLYREHEYLTEMWNQIDKDGLRPVMTELLTSSLGEGREEVRMLVVCVPK